MKSINIKDLATPDLYAFVTASISPRPIAFVSSINKNGAINLSPYSFFNVFSIDPLIFIFAPVRRTRNNTTKDTYENVKEVSEVVINIVNYDMVEQMSLASTEYEKDVNEFIKSGFTAISSDVVLPPRVKEAPVSFECKVIEIKELGEKGGSGSLVLCEGLKMHINEDVLNSDGKIEQHKIKTISRLGGAFYGKGFGEALFEVARPTRNHGVGVHQLPKHAQLSNILTGNDLGKLGGIHQIPSEEEVQLFKEEQNLKIASEAILHQKAKDYIAQQLIKEAWLTLL